MDMLIRIQSQFAKLLARGPNSDQGEKNSDTRESTKPSEIMVYIEMGIASAAALGLLAIAAWVLYSAHDWVSSIQRFQEMI